MEIQTWGKPAGFGRVSLVLLLACGTTATTLAKPQTPQGSPSCGEAPSIEGSRWHMVENTRTLGGLQDESFEFKASGKLVQHTPNGAFPNGTWTQIGGCVYFEVNEKSVEFKASIQGNRMEGTGAAQFEREFKWAAERRGGGGTAAARARGAVRGAPEPAGPGPLSELCSIKTVAVTGDEQAAKEARKQVEKATWMKRADKQEQADAILEARVLISSFSFSLAGNRVASASREGSLKMTLKRRGSEQILWEGGRALDSSDSVVLSLLKQLQSEAACSGR